MADLDNIHDLLDIVETTISALDQDPRQEIDVSDYSEFCLALNDLVGYSAYSDVQLGINSSILNKFLKFNGRVPRRTALTVTDRVRSYLRSLDQATPPRPPAQPHPTPAPRPNLLKPITIIAEEWKLVQPTSELKAKITAISSLLDAIINQMQRSNSPPEAQLLSEIDRAQLIAILETALLVLKAPIMEKGILKKTKEVLTRTASSAAEKGLQQGMGNAATEAARQLAELIKSLF